MGREVHDGSSIVVSGSSSKNLSAIKYKILKLFLEVIIVLRLLGGGEKRMVRLLAEGGTIILFHSSWTKGQAHRLNTYKVLLSHYIMP